MEAHRWQRSAVCFFVSWLKRNSDSPMRAYARVALIRILLALLAPDTHYQRVKLHLQQRADIHKGLGSAAWLVQEVPTEHLLTGSLTVRKSRLRSKKSNVRFFQKRAPQEKKLTLDFCRDFLDDFAQRCGAR